jgi:hypothetical protein
MLCKPKQPRSFGQRTNKPHSQQHVLNECGMSAIAAVLPSAPDDNDDDDDDEEAIGGVVVCTTTAFALADLALLMTDDDDDDDDECDIGAIDSESLSESSAANATPSARYHTTNCMNRPSQTTRQRCIAMHERPTTKQE